MQKWFFVTGRQRGDFYRAVGSLGVRSDGEAVISPQGGGTGGSSMEDAQSCHQELQLCKCLLWPMC